jgi:hypothetical protein
MTAMITKLSVCPDTHLVRLNRANTVIRALWRTKYP